MTGVRAPQPPQATAPTPRHLPGSPENEVFHLFFLSHVEAGWGLEESLSTPTPASLICFLKEITGCLSWKDHSRNALGQRIEPPQGVVREKG